ncbi:MAG: hypothetical protein PVG63_07545, partial [Anaerolineales bacterium]
VEYMVGETLRVSTNVIVDHNGHRVPDYTSVQFVIQTNGATVIQEVPTFNGIALFSQTLDQLGQITITAQSGNAINSDTLQLNIQEGVPIVPELITPTQAPTPETAATLVNKASQVTELNPKSGLPASLLAMDVLDWLFGMFGVLVVGTVGYYLSSRTRPTRRRQVRCTLIALLCGLLGYNYLALQLPGSDRLYSMIAPFAGFVMAVVSGLAGIILTYSWVYDPLRLRTALSMLKSEKEE